jgi:hypothetical protein
MVRGTAVAVLPPAPPEPRGRNALARLDPDSGDGRGIGPARVLHRDEMTPAGRDEVAAGVDQDGRIVTPASEEACGPGGHPALGDAAEIGLIPAGSSPYRRRSICGRPSRRRGSGLGGRTRRGRWGCGSSPGDQRAADERLEDAPVARVQ